MAKNTKKNLLLELEELAQKAGIKVRYEKTEARGGMKRRQLGENEL